MDKTFTKDDIKYLYDDFVAVLADGYKDEDENYDIFIDEQNLRVLCTLLKNEMNKGDQ